MNRWRTILAVVAAAMVATATLFMHAAPGVGVAKAAENCTLAGFAAANGIALSAPTGKSLAVTGDLSAALAREPGSSVVEQTVVHMQSAQVPPLNGRNGVLMRLANVPPQPVIGPVGSAPEMAPVACAITIYDADSGEFLVSYMSLTSH